MPGYFTDGTIHVELGTHAFFTPSGYRRNVVLEPHGRAARVLDSGGGIVQMAVTGQELRANLGDAERYIYEHFHALAASAPGTLGVEDNLSNRATAGQAVCIGASGAVHAFRFADMRFEFYAPAKAAEPAWGSVPAAPATYAGTGTLQDYGVSGGDAGGGVTLGTAPASMRIDMVRQYPLRQVPRARGARSCGPVRGAHLRFTVISHAVVTAQHLAAYLQDLERQIGPRPVDLTGNGNTYEDVVLESLRAAHTDRRHTQFEAEFLLEV